MLFFTYKNQEHAVGYWENCIGLYCGFTEIQDFLFLEGILENDHFKQSFFWYTSRKS